MKHITIITVFGLLLCVSAYANLLVKVDAPKTTGSKIVVKLTMKNTFKEKVESARAVVLLLDEQNRPVGQAAQWVIGGGKDKPSLSPNASITFNFVIPMDKVTTTNLMAKVSFNRIILEGGTVTDPRGDVHIAK